DLRLWHRQGLRDHADSRHDHLHVHGGRGLPFLHRRMAAPCAAASASDLRLPMYRGFHLIPPDTRIHFMRYHNVALAFSVIMVVGSILLIAFKGLNFGVDFAGGILMEVTAPGPADLGSLRSQISGLGLGEASLQEFGKAETVLIRLQHQ